MSSGVCLGSCFYLLRMRIDDRIRLIIRPLPLLIFIIKIATKILGAWTYTSVVQASVEITGEPTDTSDDCIVFATIPSDIAANQPFCTVSVATWFKSYNRSWTDSNTVCVTTDSETVEVLPTIVVTQSTFQRTLLTHACIRGRVEDFDAEQLERAEHRRNCYDYDGNHDIRDDNPPKHCLGVPVREFTIQRNKIDCAQHNHEKDRGSCDRVNDVFKWGPQLRWEQ